MYYLMDLFPIFDILLYLTLQTFLNREQFLYREFILTVNSDQNLKTCIFVHHRIFFIFQEDFEDFEDYDYAFSREIISNYADCRCLNIFSILHGQCMEVASLAVFCLGET